MKLKLNTSGKAGSPTAGSPPPVSAAPTPTSSGGFKLKLKSSAPPTPANENAPHIQPVEPLAPPPTKPKRPYNKKPKDGDAKKPGKRGADSDISPAPKRPAVDSPKRKISFKLSGSLDTALADNIDVAPSSATPISAGPKLKLAPSRRSSTGPKAITLTAKKRPPPRPVGVGYDSEASDAETDPAIEQQFVLRMPDPSSFPDEPTRTRVRDDASYLRTAIEEKRMGLPLAEGGADISFRFVSRDLRRAVVTIRGQRYTAMLVDLPCVVESLKSWDRRGGWWKVADLAQLLLVLEPIPRDDDADHAANQAEVPHDVDKKTYRYAHGLTPPMHYVRRRRFRKRVSHREIEGAEEKVEALLREDREVEARGGRVEWSVRDTDEDPQVLETRLANEDVDAEGEVDDSEFAPYGGTAVETPSQFENEEEDELMEADLLAGLENMDEEEFADEPVSALPAVDATRSSSIAGADSSGAATPGEGAGEPSSSDEDDDDDSDDGRGDAVDEDALAEANEKAAQREEIADLEREVRNKRLELERVTNQLLRQRVKSNLRALEDELDMKRKAFGMEDEEDEDEDEEE
ncbi:hypothetical protein K461DRAFT_322588 [Myriangium duriaei CBS 260.36]|uniref:TAFII55 protein conserved region domain-containing protein n=1 Tax=Myriangium duriaei CBS 260.36 TaxID=1168546 RepID=A0A9P4J2Q8_9PEZI|nr:hypothetical protein K461DRAFT_322588 [Myriangium duriaei CBS 260.36]